MRCGIHFHNLNLFPWKLQSKSDLCMSGCTVYFKVSKYALNPNKDMEPILAWYSSVLHFRFRECVHDYHPYDSTLNKLM